MQCHATRPLTYSSKVLTRGATASDTDCGALERGAGRTQQTYCPARDATDGLRGEGTDRLGSWIGPSCISVPGTLGGGSVAYDVARLITGA